MLGVRAPARGACPRSGRTASARRASRALEDVKKVLTGLLSGIVRLRLMVDTLASPDA
jgi:hypothetical protein